MVILCWRWRRCKAGSATSSPSPTSRLSGKSYSDARCSDWPMIQMLPIHHSVERFPHTGLNIQQHLPRFHLGNRSITQYCRDMAQYAAEYPSIALCRYNVQKYNNYKQHWSVDMCWKLPTQLHTLNKWTYLEDHILLSYLSALISHITPLSASSWQFQRAQ